MTTDRTEMQSGAELQRAKDMSLQRGHPPTQVPGYEPERFLGVGAYGEVWVAVERNTSRRVAIKFYAHRGGLDWSLLSREVEKLAFLFADRYVVQLLGVGWDADPPYYIMEYLEKGSLADRIARGPIPVDEAVALFRDVAMGLVHAHGKGVLHCDLKPANILLDQDGKPRLADFGQSRLSHEQAPALGTMFYMAPEQADLEAVPDARWDVYALGALLYCMLTGEPPHRDGKTVDQFQHTPDLTARLTSYRRMLEQSPTPSAHRKVRGVDASLASIVDRCLASDPERRFPNVQAVLDALGQRRARLARRPLMVLGAIGPALLLAVVAWFAWHGFSGALGQSNAALTEQALQSDKFAAEFAARAAANELEHRYQLVEQVAASESFRHAAANALAKPALEKLLTRLSDPNLEKAEAVRLRQQFLDNSDRQALQKAFVAAISSTVGLRDEDAVASWFFCDPNAVSTVRVPRSDTVGKNYAWRSYFHGGPRDHDEGWRPAPGQHIEMTTLSDVFQSQASQQWIVAISVPVYDTSPEKKFLGIVAMTANMGALMRFSNGDDLFAVLVDNRDGPHKGVMLQHPLYDKLLQAQTDVPEAQRRLPERCGNYRLAADDLPTADNRQRAEHYRDPVAVDPQGDDYDQRWLAQIEPIRVRDKDTGWLVLVQEAYQPAIGKTLRHLTAGLIHSGLIALAFIALVMAGLWAMAKRLSGTREG